MQSRRRFVYRPLIAVLLLEVLLRSIAAANDLRQGGPDEHWVATWSTALHPPDLLIPGLSNNGFNNQTLRQIVHVSAGGRQIRVRLSAFGAGGLVVGAAHIALSSKGPAIVPGTDRTLTFGGKPTITIPPGAPVVSDPVELEVPDLGNLAVSLYVPGATGPATWHFDSRQTSYISPQGDFSDSFAMPLDPATPRTQSWFWLAGIDVMAPRQSAAIAAVGESTTDGDKSTVDANRRWTDALANRLASDSGHRGVGVVNEGLDGNRLLHDSLGPNGLGRFERDVLSQSGLAYVIVYFGINDIGVGWPGGLNPSEEVSVDQIVQGYRQLIERAHTRGVKIFGATITPFEGSFIPGTPFPLSSPGNETKRKQVNAWIRGSGEFDGVIDFDRAVRDPNVPTRLLAPYDSGDHVHPNDAGYRAMANAIDLGFFDQGDR